jgi:hypothetical protein
MIFSPGRTLGLLATQMGRLDERRSGRTIDSIVSRWIVTGFKTDAKPLQQAGPASHSAAVSSIVLSLSF